MRTASPLRRDQVELIWKSKWSIPKVLYLLSRYLPVIDTTATFLCAKYLVFATWHIPDLLCKDQFLYELTLPVSIRC
jgi:hypothetical protein